MNTPVTTSMMLTPTAPATPATAPSAAESVAGGGFQPVLAALTQAAAEGVATVLPPGTTAAMPSPATGKLLPASGQPLPQVVDVEASVADLEVTAAIDPTLLAIDPAITLPVATETVELPLDTIASADTSDLMAETDVDPSVTLIDGMPEPVAQQSAPTTTTTAIATAAVTTTVVTAAPSTGPAIPPPVSGEIKRLLPESTSKASSRTSATEATTNGTATFASASTPIDGDVPPVFDLATLTQAVEGSDSVEQPSAATGSTATVSALRENSLRAYQNAAPATTQIEVPVGRQGWSEAVLEKVMWFSAQQMGSAEIHLNPAELGPLSVRISTHQDQASVYFSSQHAAVRDALDQALPRLREMLDGQGIQLLDAGVGEQRQTRQQAGQQDSSGAALAESGDDGTEGGAADIGSRALLLNNRLLDAYA